MDATNSSGSPTTSETLNKEEVPNSTAHTVLKKQSEYTTVYKPGENLFEGFKPGKFITVYIPANFLFQKIEKHVWGTDIYTDDSDIIAACIHSGKLDLIRLRDKAVVLKGVLVKVKIEEADVKRVFRSSYRKLIKSKSWSNHTGNAYSIQKVKLITDKLTKVKIPGIQRELNLNNVLSDSDFQRLRDIPNIAIVYNLSNEPCLKYSKESIGDKGIDKHSFTSYRLTKEVIYLENDSTRYELSMNQDDISYNFVQVLQPFLMDLESMQKLSIPLPSQHTNPLHMKLKWTDISWGDCSIKIGNDKEYFVSKVLFVQRTTPIAIKEE